MLRERADQLALVVDVEVVPYKLAGSYGVGVEWGETADEGVSYEVADWMRGVRILDPDGENVTVEQGLAYFEARAGGERRQQALRGAVGARSRAPFGATGPPARAASAVFSVRGRGDRAVGLV